MGGLSPLIHSFVPMPQIPSNALQLSIAQEADGTTARGSSKPAAALLQAVISHAGSSHFLQKKQKKHDLPHLHFQAGSGGVKSL